MGVEPGWDCGRYRLDGPNGLLLHCRVSMISMISMISMMTVKVHRKLGKGGGVALLIKDGICAMVRDELGSGDQDVEFVWVQMRKVVGQRNH